MDAGTSLTTSCVDAGPVRVVTVDGEIDIMTAPELRTALQEAVAAEERKPVVVDLTGVRLLSSVGLAVLSEIHEVADKAGMPLRVVFGSSRLVVRMLQLSGLSDVLAVHRDVQDAVRAAARPRNEGTDDLATS